MSDPRSAGRELTDRERARTRNHNIIIEGWFAEEKAAMRFAELNRDKDMLYRASFTHRGFIAYRRVKCDRQSRRYFDI